VVFLFSRNRVAEVLISALSGFDERIKLAFIYGSVARGEETAGSDIDIMIVSDKLSYPDAVGMFTQAEIELGRSINPSIYTPGELRKKLSGGVTALLPRCLARRKYF
jgi:predicted nucleotidyltransferase